MNSLAIIILQALTSEQHIPITPILMKYTGENNLTGLNVKALKAWEILLNKCPEFHEAVIRMEEYVL